VALSYYACAPLYWSPGVFLLLALSLLWEWFVAGDLERFLNWLAAIYAAVLVFLWWLGIVRIAGGTLAPVRRRLTVAVLVPILWLLTLVIVLLGIPWLTLYVVAIFFSLYG
jgi:hypothetical protein